MFIGNVALAFTILFMKLAIAHCSTPCGHTHARYARTRPHPLDQGLRVGENGAVPGAIIVATLIDHLATAAAFRSAMSAVILLVYATIVVRRQRAISISNDMLRVGDSD